MKNAIKLTAVLLGGALLLSSCEKFFEPSVENKLEADENYQLRSTVYASFVGLYSLLQEVAPQLVILSELRSDLLMPTDNAPDDYWKIYRYEGDEENAVADPSPLYRIVVNCNDFLRNVVKYNSKYPGVIPGPTYRQMVGGAVTLRAWAYLQIGKFFGEAVYYDYAMTGEKRREDLRVLSFDQLVPELIFFMENGVDGVDGMRDVDFNGMFGTTGIWSGVPVSADALMLELYLWNKDYQMAAKRGINMITGQSVTPIGTNDRLTCSYLFGSDANGTNKWYKLWSVTPVQANIREGATVVLYSYAQRQINPLYSIFSADVNCKYWLKPTNILVGKFSGKDYVSSGKSVTDCRGEGVTYYTEKSDRMMYKYCKDRTLQQQDPPLYLYRGAEIHLMIAEALNALSNYDAADAFINNGFQPCWVSGARFNAPFDAPIYAFEKLKVGRGVRGRCDLPKISSTDSRFMGTLTPDSLGFAARRKAVLDSLIVEETARELAGEGKRWFSLMRIARNNGDPAFLAETVCRKFSGARSEKARLIMMNPDNWFISSREPVPIIEDLEGDGPEGGDPEDGTPEGGEPGDGSPEGDE